MSCTCRPTPVTLGSLVVAGLLSLLAATGAFAQPRPSSQLLLPYFEVDLDGFRRTTLFTLANSGREPVEARMVVHSNWGIPMEEVRVTLGPRETRRFNLRDWLMLGELPQANGLVAVLSPRRLPHLHAALSGQRSPADGHFYGTEVLSDVAVGYVTVLAHALGETERTDVLWGNYFLLDPEEGNAQGDVLVDIDPAHGSPGLCRRHDLFVLGGSDSGTEVIVWTPGQATARPSVTAAPAAVWAQVETEARGLEGETMAETARGLLATQTLTLEDLTAGGGSSGPLGSLALATVAGAEGEPIASFVAVRYRAQRYSASLQAWCLDPEDDTPGGLEPSADP